MSDSSLRLPDRASIEQLRKQAKELLRAYHAGDVEVTERFGSRISRLSNSEQSPLVVLADAQFVLAREYGFENWAQLVHHVITMKRSSRIAPFEQLAQDLATAYMKAMPRRSVKLTSSTAAH